MGQDNHLTSKKSLITIGDTILRSLVGDISQIGTMDAVVNSANHELSAQMGGVNTSIHKTAGSGLLQECRQLHGCKTGEAKITGAYQIHAKHIIHTVCPTWRGGHNNEIDMLKQCYIKSLDVAVENSVYRIAFPLIGAGDLSFPINTAAKVAVHTVGNYVKEHPSKLFEVVWVLYDFSTKSYVDIELEDYLKHFESNDTLQDIPKVNQEKAPAITSNEAVAQDQNPVPQKTTMMVEDSDVILHCPKDMKQLIRGEQKRAKMNGVLTTFRLYRCPLCGIQYSCISELKDLVGFRIGSTQYTNLHKENDDQRVKSHLKSSHDLKNGLRLITYKVTPAHCKICKGILQDEKIEYFSEIIKKKITYSTKYCEACDIHYLHYSEYKSGIAPWSLMNGREQKQWENEKLSKEKPVQKSAITEKKALIQKPTIIQNPKKTEKPIKIKPTENPITAKDFVVRRSVFKCRYNNHPIQDVQAVFTTISRFGNVHKIRIPAGYCPKCKMYFILESTYQRIKSSGVPICRTMDEKAYILHKKGNGLSSYGNFAQESVLMQFGYSVNQVDDLPPTQRRMILAAIIDNDVLTKSDVISYLDSFINYRKNQKNRDGSLKYQVAIGRWKDDRKFIQNYKTGTYKEVQIKKIIVNN